VPGVSTGRRMMTSFGFLTSAIEMAFEMPGSSLLALELPRAITPVMAGLTVGVFVGVVGIIAVLVLVGRSNRKYHARRASAAAPYQVVFIPPYGTMQRDTPLPPQAFATPGRATGIPHLLHRAPAPRANPNLGFVPSTSLSARVFAKMAAGADDSAIFDSAEMDVHDAPHSDPIVSFDVDMLDEDDLILSHTPAPAGAPVLAAVTVSPVVVLSAPTPFTAPPPSLTKPAPGSAPHPLGIINAGSSAMRPASIADLAFDDGPTEIGETYFDEPPQPRRRTDPPKIRAVAPSGPRFRAAEETPALPQVTPPPARAANRGS
jgi:hypothetical protein